MWHVALTNCIGNEFQILVYLFFDLFLDRYSKLEYLSVERIIYRNKLLETVKNAKLISPMIRYTSNVSFLYKSKYADMGMLPGYSVSFKRFDEL